MVMKLVVAFVTLATLSRAVTVDYYWKDFYGEVPPDAFPGGTDAAGNPTYIGQTYFEVKNFVVPTVIEGGNKWAYTGIGNVKFESDKNTKILCARNSTTLQWIHTTTNKMRLLMNCSHVYGGTSEDALFTIGRANHQGRTITGHVADDIPHNWFGLYIFDWNFKKINLQEFELLVSNCQ